MKFFILFQVMKCLLIYKPTKDKFYMGVKTVNVLVLKFMSKSYGTISYEVSYYI